MIYAAITMGTRKDSKVDCAPAAVVSQIVVIVQQILVVYESQQVPCSDDTYSIVHNEERN